ncbi:MAG: excinuclease ABC subunit UvrB [Bacteroidales bacterium]|nr:excinuclease ABC subunit UvrB [Bacteroidales bacterium]MDD3960442.1 excinuclease ABC subunit UvrB [Bacteroidales bacterium]MDY0285942.1 excinuclease ABC subunit UvrB [Bacteroidales bacterium]HPE86123.1 excinuclease ABC subunit UvrB [Bacteroidales bacterium]
MAKPFILTSDFQPTGDQPEAIKQLTEGILRQDKAQVLLGVTGSGKTFTIANVIEKVQKPILVLSHNKTLAAQLYGEFKQFFPDNAVEYFVSYYDYYQPEAYLPVSDTYIEKDLSINDEIEKLRLSASSALLSGRRDVIVVSSVSCIYGIGNPEEFASNTVYIHKGDHISRNTLLHKFVVSLYSRTETELTRGTFRVKGDSVDIFPAYADFGFRILFWGDEIESMEVIEPETGKRVEELEEITIYPANIFVTTQETLNKAIREIQEDLFAQTAYFRSIGKHLEAKRLEDRVTYDIEMMKELGYCSGIENYSRYFDRRSPGSRPFCLIDYFPDDFLLVIDESHVTIPQIRAMYGGDRSRKQNLVEFGFRLPSALDNRPLTFDEFEQIIPQTVYVSATPADYELKQSEGVVVEQLIRPTGLPDPIIEVRPAIHQVDDLLDEIDRVIKMKERVLVTTLTKRMAEELTKYMARLQVKCQYIHSDVDTLERVEIMHDLRTGKYDVLVGVNLLREGLDLPEVSLVAILDADKEGFLRSERALTQTAGRAARNLNARVIMYADKITESMQRTMDETERRRLKQIAYNTANHITPRAIVKSIESVMGPSNATKNAAEKTAGFETQKAGLAADPVVQYMSKQQLKKAIQNLQQQMEKVVKELDFIEAARLRDEMFVFQHLLEEKE